MHNTSKSIIKAVAFVAAMAVFTTAQPFNAGSMRQIVTSDNTLTSDTDTTVGNDDAEKPITNQLNGNANQNNDAQTEKEEIVAEEPDYSELIESNKSEEYRESVETDKSSIIVMREETESSSSISNEEWFRENNIVGIEKLYERDSKDSDKKVVSYKLTVDTPDVWDLTDKINDTEDVLIAEPDYVFYTCAVPSGSNNAGMESEWYLDDQNMTTIWADPSTYGNTTGEGVVVAVIDTGVDYGHEDLKDNMWINTAELMGDEGVDDDNNGYVDDIYGVSFIDGSSNPMDDNGHGTHVAGIIAMSDNGVGGVGLAYKAQIMAIKAGRSDGSFNSSDIAKAIEYAYKNGADVINMSFGSYAHSAIIEKALQDAFSTSVLVAAAGNDSFPTLDAPVACSGNMYPAAYSYVIGVMAYDTADNLANFSNWDFKMNYGAEYEIAAPGAGIYSTLPGDRYASWSGTSMAAPVVAAAAAILRSAYPDKDAYSSRFIMGQLVSATDETITFKSPLGNTYNYAKLSVSDSLTKKPKPNINVTETYIFDSPEISSKNNGDGIVQPGETIDIAVGLRNQWGAATNVNILVNATSSGGVANPYVTFVNGNSVLVNDIGTFGTQNNGFIYNDSDTVIGVTNPIRVTISENAPNDEHIAFNINYTASNAMDSSDTTVYRQKIDTVFTVNIQKGVVLKGKITEDMTLSSDNYYIVENSLLIPKGVTVIVEPGTKIQFWSADSSSVYSTENIALVQVEGVMDFRGTEEAPIHLFPGKDYENYRVEVQTADSGIVNMSYVDIINPYISITEGDHLSIIQDYDNVWYKYIDSFGKVESSYGRSYINVYGSISDSKISNLRGISLWDYAIVGGHFDTVLFENCQIEYQNSIWDESTQTYTDFSAINCTFLGNQGRVEDGWTGTLQYFASRMSAIGNKYISPELKPVTEVLQYNGKKYVIYQKSANFLSTISDTDDYYDEYMLTLDVIEGNGGTLGLFNVSDDWQDEGGLYSEIYDELQTSDFMTGMYYDRDSNSVVTTNGESPWSNVTLTATNPFVYQWISKSDYYDYTYDEYGNVVSEELKTGYVNAGSNISWLMSYWLAEYPETVSDYDILNPVVNLEELGVLENKKFKNNAILNRLTSKNTDDWMKLVADQNNDAIYMATENYWGTTDPVLIQKQLLDFDTNIIFGDYIVDPYLLTPAETTYPCVSDIYILDKDGNKIRSTGNGKIEIHVLFNRAMDTSVQPMVTYGPDDPYTDYTFSGDWESATEWVGTATIKTIINQGEQFIRVKDAVAADDAWLTTGTDWARFNFNIEASGAEALSLQGEGVMGGVYLNWVQDDYDTLAGYNIYRSTTGDEGTYERANSSIISADTKEFTDKKVNSGQKYYYYFTVVDTDLSESMPSNVITCASIDDQVPVITHTNRNTFTLGINATITATITDNVGVNSAYLYYRMRGASSYTEVMMTCTNNNSYSAQIPAKALSEGTLEYYFKAADSVSFGYGGTADAPYTVLVENKMFITSVISDGGEVGSNVTAVINGMNFDKNVEVYIDNEKVESKFVSSEKIEITGYTPEYMGMKKVCLYLNDEQVAYYNNAIAVTDDSIYIRLRPATIVLEQNEWQGLFWDTNFSGKLSALEVSLENSESFTNMIYPNFGYRTYEESYDEDGKIKTLTYKMGTTTFSGDAHLLYTDLHNIANTFSANITDLKINGISINTSNIENTEINFIDASQYVEVEKVDLDTYYQEVEFGDTFAVDYTVYPSNATRRDEVSYSYDSSVFRLNEDGTFTALKSSICGYITVYVGGIPSESMNVSVKAVEPTSVTTEKTDYIAVVGSAIELSVEVLPLEASDSIGWSSSDWETAEVTSSNGSTARVVFKKEGFVTIQAGYGDMWVSFNIEVIENSVYADISEDIVTLYPNAYTTVTATVLNTQDANVDINWTSSNSSVARVNADGTITATGNGIAIISATAEGGTKSDTVIVLVGSDSMSYTRGDINMDGNITATDAMLALKLALISDCNDAILKIADVNGDGTVTSSDSMRILQYVTGAIEIF